MFTLEFDVKGIKEISNKLLKVKDELQREAYWELFRFTNDEILPNVQHYASQGAMTSESEPFPLGANVPVSGYLAGSVGIIGGTGTYKNRTIATIAIISNASYAAAQELGWFMTEKQAQVLAIERRKKGIELPPLNLGYPHWVQHPFMRPGVYGKINEAIKDLEDFLNKKLKG